MVNHQSGEPGGRQWYPQLPEGYEQNDRHHVQPSQPPWYTTPGYPPGQGMPNYGAPGYHPPGRPPWQNPPGQHQPGRPPGHQPPGQHQPGRPPGHQPPGQHQPGRPPGHQPPGQHQPGRPPGHGIPGHRPPQYDPPGMPPGHRPPGGSPGHHPGQQPPSSRPPQWTPEYPSHRPYAIDAGAISGCMYRFTYIWTSRRNGFWFYPTFVGRTSVSGFRWDAQRHRWEYAGLDLNRIDSFTCY